MIRIVLAEAHHLIRQSIKAIVEKNGDIEIIGEAADGLEAVTMVARFSPDLVIMDIVLSCLNGIQAIEKNYTQLLKQFLKVKFILVRPLQD